MGDQYAVLDLQVIETHDAARDRDVLTGDADVAAADAPVLNQPPGDEFRRVDRNRKADALRGQDDGRVNADDFAPRGDERAAGVTGIERRVRLDDVVNQAAGIRPQRATERADHARRHGRLKAVRVADGDDDLS